MAAPAPAAPPAAPVSQVYTWEPSSHVLAARYGLQPSDILRFDLNTSPLPSPDLAAALAGPFDPPLNEYPDSMYIALADAAAAYVGVDPSQILVGAGADEVLDIIAKTFLPSGGRAIVPIPTQSCDDPPTRGSASTSAGCCPGSRARTSSGCAPPTTRRALQNR